MSGIDTAQLAIYATFSLPILYILTRHGLPGLLGWAYLFAFCTLRIVGAALALGKGNVESAAIISNIGLSPLLLATSGVLHEARHYRSSRRTGSSRGEWVMVISFHLLVTTGLALVASGAAAFGVSTAPKTSDEGLVKGGIVVLLLSWIVVVVWMIVSFFPGRYDRKAPGFAQGTKIIRAVAFTIPFSGIRTLYSVVSILAPSGNLSPVSGSLGLRIGLEVLEEVIVVFAFIVVGLMTHRVKGTVKRSEHAELAVREKRQRGRSGNGEEHAQGESEEMV